MGGIIAGVVAPSTCDWYGYSALVLFFSGCNWACPMCFNHEIIPMHGKHYTDKQLEKLVKQNKSCCDVVVASGGEPTLQDQTCEVLFTLAHKYNLLTMLNTNGSQPMVILDLVEKGLVDKIAMDIKAPLCTLEYGEMTGTNDPLLSNEIACTLNLINKLSVDLELRTTVVKDTYSSGKHLYRLIDDIAKHTKEFHLQEFDDSECLDPALKGKIVGRAELIEYAKYAKMKGIKKVVVKSKLNGFEEV